MRESAVSFFVLHVPNILFITFISKRFVKKMDLIFVKFQLRRNIDISVLPVYFFPVSVFGFFFSIPHQPNPDNQVCKPGVACIGVRAGGSTGELPPKIGEDQIRANSSGRIGKNKFLNVIITEKFSKIGNDE